MAVDFYSNQLTHDSLILTHIKELLLFILYNTLEAQWLSMFASQGAQSSYAFLML